MPHASVKLVDGVNVNRTPVLNEFGLSTSQLIRYQYDGRGEVMIQKIGGWQRFYPTATVAPVRALWGWESTENRSFLGVGTQNIGSSFSAQLSVIVGGTQQDITPRQSIDNIAIVAESTIGSPLIKITDTTTTGITGFDSVYIPVHIAIGGVILFGLYTCDPDGFIGATTYTVLARDILGNPWPAASSSTSPVLPLLTTTAGANAVTVTLPNHGYVAGNNFPILIPTTVAGATFFGHFPVVSVTDANNFVIVATETPNASTTGYINNNKEQFIYNVGIGALPPGTGFGIGGFGRGGFGTGAGTTPLTGTPISATNWTLDNWGEIFLACPSTSPIVLTTTGASGTGAVGTITFSQPYVVPVGSTIVVAGVLPSAWNGTYVATASSSGSVSFASALTSSLTQQGTIGVEIAEYAPIYEWDSEGGAPTAVVNPAAPPVSEGIFVAMPQRQIVAYGTTETGVKDPLLIRWCDVNNRFQWTDLVINQAGSYRLTRGSKIVGAIQGPQQGLLWTDIGLWSMQYIGPPLIYGFNEIGTGCGLIAKKAAAAINGVVFWMGPSQFYSLTANGVLPLPCPVWDVMFQDIDLANLDKIRVAVNSRFNEIAWFIPTLTSGGEVATYAKYNMAYDFWDYGQLSRSAWIDQSVLGPPIGADPNSLLLFQHEVGNDADGQPLVSNWQSGYFALAEGDRKIFVDQWWPDMRWGDYGAGQNATVNLTFLVKDYPNDTPHTYGPFALNAGSTFITPRFRGRLVAIGMESDDLGSFWRIGLNRYRWAEDGRF